MGPKPSLGACRPDIRRQVRIGDHIFVVSGKVNNAKQFVMCGFEVVRKINARDAYVEFPDRRLHRQKDGQLTGNVIVNGNGYQHHLDDHPNFEKRLPNYLLGDRNIAPMSANGIALAREQTLDVLREVLRKNGKSPIEVIGRWGSQLNEDQVHAIRNWLLSLNPAP